MAGDEDDKIRSPRGGSQALVSSSPGPAEVPVRHGTSWLLCEGDKGQAKPPGEKSRRSSDGVGWRVSGKPPSHPRPRVATLQQTSQAGSALWLPPAKACPGPLFCCWDGP